MTVILANDDEDPKPNRQKGDSLMGKFTIRSNHDNKTHVMFEGTHEEFRDKLRQDEQNEIEAKKQADEREKKIKQRQAALDPRSDAKKKLDEITDHIADLKRQGRREGVRVLQPELQRIQAIVDKEERRKDLLKHPKVRDALDYVTDHGDQFDSDLRDKLQLAADVARQLDSCDPDQVAACFWDDFGPIKREQNERDARKAADLQDQAKQQELQTLKNAKEQAALKAKRLKLEGGADGKTGTQE